MRASHVGIMPAVASVLDCSQYSMWPSALCRRRSLSPSGVTTLSARCFSRWSSRPVSPARHAACSLLDPSGRYAEQLLNNHRKGEEGGGHQCSMMKRAVHTVECL